MIELVILLIVYAAHFGSFVVYIDSYDYVRL